MQKFKTRFDEKCLKDHKNFRKNVKTFMKFWGNYGKTRMLLSRKISGEIHGKIGIISIQNENDGFKCKFQNKFDEK